MKANPLTEYRERLGLTRSELAVLLNQNYSQLAGIESGRIEPTAPLLRALAAEGVDAPEFEVAWRKWHGAKQKEIARKAGSGNANGLIAGIEDVLRNEDKLLESEAAPGVDVDGVLADLADFIAADADTVNALYKDNPSEKTWAALIAVDGVLKAALWLAGDKNPDFISHKIGGIAVAMEVAGVMARRALPFDIAGPTWALAKLCSPNITNLLRHRDTRERRRKQGK